MYSVPLKGCWKNRPSFIIRKAYRSVFMTFFQLEPASSTMYVTMWYKNFLKWKLNPTPIKVNKESCNWWHGLSAAIKLGSLEKTVGTCLLRSGVYYEQSFLCRKNCTTQLFAFVGDSPFFYKKISTKKD